MINPNKNILNLKKFKALDNSSNGEVGEGTVFSYHQKDNIIWATYEGGNVVFGTLSGLIKNDKLEFTYQHTNIQEDFMTGKCKSQLIFKEQKIQLHETWEWTCKDFSKGHSILEEI